MPSDSSTESTPNQKSVAEGRSTPKRAAAVTGEKNRAEQMASQQRKPTAQRPLPLRGSSSGLPPLHSKSKKQQTKKTKTS